MAQVGAGSGSCVNQNRSRWSSTSVAEKRSTIDLRCKAWCSETGSLMSLVACCSGASSDLREQFSLHQAVLSKMTMRSKVVYVKEMERESYATLGTPKFIIGHYRPSLHEHGSGYIRETILLSRSVHWFAVWGRSHSSRGNTGLQNFQRIVYS